MKDLSICILAYNAENFINETLRSLERQDIEFKYLLVIDGSTDKTADICYEFQKQSERQVEIKEFIENHGTAYCRNWAINHVDTKYIMFFDSDDVARPQLVRRLFQKISEDDDCIAVSCCAVYIDINGKKLPGGMFFKMADKSDFQKKAKEGKFIFMLPATLFKREYAIQAGGYRLKGFPEGKVRYEDLSEDLDLWSRMSDFYTDGKYMVILPEVLYYYRKRIGSLTASKDRQYAMCLKMEFIKDNIKRRRSGRKEIVFTDFLNNQTTWEKIRNKIKFYSEYMYRQAAFAFAGKRYLKAILCVPILFILNPKYLIQKFTVNIGKL